MSPPASVEDRASLLRESWSGSRGVRRCQNMDRNPEHSRPQHDNEHEDPFSRVQGELETVYPDSEWDAGDMGCGELVMELRIRLRSVPAGHILKLTARDPGAPEDLPAWCRLTGHHLTYADHPIYVIRRKED
jgi:tRNA 2-thiouridine synthesizing protein A